MHALALSAVTQAALAAGLPAGRVFETARKDNLTQPRPRVELQFLPEKHTRTGRLLGIVLNQETKRQERTREIYKVELGVLATVYAETEAWLSEFCYGFMAAMPRGMNDSRGNWVKIRSAKAQFVHAAPPRVGEASIEPIKKFSQLFSIAFTGRITAVEEDPLIETFTINPTIGGQHGQDQG